ncbi:gastrula zinc finger protein XlCGF8.2DB-like [Poeciliopsis prolifica]|uniref:gastrula zinc finger protein XlCGF8.2DB-like n=1 Tax=Poeciliopsis prolifica TaxID=188132 RepID=UPI0024134767|nr:gastrula zinc finger protein XlCGF8.2DB-like [Poeciliopsis prolifica]
MEAEELQKLDFQQVLLVKEELPEGRSPGVDLPDPESLQIKEDQEDHWSSMKEETDASWFPVTTVIRKPEEDEEANPVSSQQTGNADIPVSYSVGLRKLESEGEDCRKLDCSADESSSDTDVSEDNVGNLNGSDSQLEGFSFRCLVNRKYTMKKNLKLRDSQMDLKCFSCNECGKSFLRENLLKIHVRIHTGEKPFSCELCGQRFIQKSNLNRHMRFHTGEKPFWCHLCGQTFSWKSSLDCHMRIHTGEKPFSCDFCGQTFGEKSVLNTHMRIHTGDKPFSCDVCEQRFNQSSHLKRHMRIHTGEKPYCCEVCGQRFGDKSVLNIHMGNHTGDKPFGCHVCGQRFSRKCILDSHMKSTQETNLLTVIFVGKDLATSQL